MTTGQLFTILIILVAIIIAPVKATEENNYRLRAATVDEYVQAVPAIIQQAYSEDSQTYFLVRKVISQEFNLRYGDADLAELPFDVLSDFQIALAIGTDVLLAIDERAWFAGMLRAALRNNQRNHISQGFTVGNFDIATISTDFNGDSTDEYLLEVLDNWSMRTFYALADETVQLLPLPIVGLPGDMISRGSAESGRLAILNIADLDDDGDDEIIVEGYQYGYWASCGDLYVLDWQAGEVVDRTGELFSYCLPLAQLDTASILFDTDQPGAIQLIETRVDGWNCQRVRTDTLNLINDMLRTDTVYADTAWCDLREASEAFEQRDYARAVDIYQSALPNFEGQMEQYLMARLALSHALKGQSDEAQSTLETAQPTGQMGALLTRLEATDIQVEAMCREAYDFFAEINLSQENQYANPYEWTPTNFYFGREFLDPRYYPLPDPAQAGCDYRNIFESEPTPIPTPDEEVTVDVWSLVANQVYHHLRRGDYEQVLSQIETVFTLPPENYQDYELPLRYWRALTLELSGRSDEALAEYIAIIDTAPDSAWGMLAALHVE